MNFAGTTTGDIWSFIIGPESSNKLNPDITADGKVNFLDYAVLLSKWLEIGCHETNNWCNKSDIDKSGAVDLADLLIITQNWLHEISMVGDFNIDYKVDFKDFAEFSTYWFALCSSPAWCSGTDMNKSGRVDFIDLLDFGQHWLEGATSAYLPKGADINGDRRVDYGDMIILADQWLQPPGNPSADIAPPSYGDGIVILP